MSVDAQFLARFAERWNEIKAASAGMVSLSLAERLALSHDAVDLRSMLQPVDWQRFLYDWSVWGRPKQFAPSWEWDVWITVGGRASGKTRDKAEWVLGRMQRGEAKEIALVGPSFGEIRKVMIGGFEKRSDGMNGSALLDILPPWIEVKTNEQRGELYFPQFNAHAYAVSAEKPEFVGHNPDTVWCDEPIAWPNPEKLLEHIFLSNRKRGKKRPQMGMSTTPRPVQWLRELVMDEKTATTHAKTWENQTNLAKAYIERQKRKLAGTRLGAQELEAELLGDNPDALFAMTNIGDSRVMTAPTLDRIVVAVDPAVSENRRSDETGIVGVGRVGDRSSGSLYVLDDASGKYQFERWADAVCDMAETLGANAIVAERNRVGDGALSTIRLVGQARGWKLVAKRGGGNGHDLVTPKGQRIELLDILAMGSKETRAEPVATLYQKGRVHHVGVLKEGYKLAQLEDEITNWNPKRSKSPNRLDALVHGANELIDLTFQEVDAREGFSGLREAVEQMTALDPGARRVGPGLPALLSELTRVQGWGSKL